MKIGIPREIKEGERRVALLPRDAGALAAGLHAVLVERGAGLGVGAGDDEYRRAGATPATTDEVWACPMIVKVKEMLEPDLARARPGQVIFGFQQLPGAPERTRALAARGVTAIAFETVRDAHDGFPLLAPMSVISGRMAVEALWHLLPANGPRVVVLGAGNAGSSAAAVARERGASVLVLTRSVRSRDAARDAGFTAELATPESVEHSVLGADLVIGAVLKPGERTPKLLPRSLVRRMRRGAAIADISIDGGGVAETSRPTTHAAPTFVEEGIVHYCVPNIPAADPVASTEALSRAVLPLAGRLASGIGAALRESPGLRAGVLLWKGRVNHRGIAQEAGLPYTALSDEDLA